MTGKPGMAESYPPWTEYLSYAEGEILDGSFRCLERKLYILECLMKLFKSMGAKIKGTQLMWWPSMLVQRKSQNINGRPQVARAGFMSESRGLHWDRKSRYGVR